MPERSDKCNEKLKSYIPERAMLEYIFDKYYYLDEDNSLLFEDSEIVDDSKLIEVISNFFRCVLDC